MIRSLHIVGFLIVIAACGSDSGRPTDGGSAADAGPVADSGRRDAGPGTDAGSGDPCAADDTMAAATVGCNGAPAGPSAADAFGGACTPDMATDEGSCTGADAYCDDTHDDGMGQCLQRCVPLVGSYVSTGACPMGSRCFDLEGDGNGFCFPDCATGADCASGACDLDRSCVDPDACAADDTMPATTIGCNGAEVGAQPANALAGVCTPDGMGGQGSCTDPDHVCDDLDEDGMGVCISFCFSSGDFYVSEGGCPEGYRCFDLAGDGDAWCYADCDAATDCASGTCDGDGACSS